MGKVMKWQYSGTADITLGKEVHISPLPKIALVVTISIIVLLCTLGAIFRDYLYDVFINPQIILKYVNQTDNGYEVNVPLQYAFAAEKFIDEVNTKEYDAFMNPDNLEYTYSVDGTVNTSTVGSYQVTYNSSNRANTKQILLTVNVTDSVAPTATLQNPLTHAELSKGKDGNYKPIFIVRGKATNIEEGYYGTNSWKPEDFVLDISDNYSEKDKIVVTYPDNPDWSGTEAEYKELVYTFADESNNKTEMILPVYVVSLEEYETQDIKVDGLNLNNDIQNQIDQIAQATQDKNNRENNNNNHNGNGDANDPGPANSDIDPNDDDSWRADNWQDTPTNDDGSHTGRNPQISADSFTWSVSVDGPLTSGAFWARAQSKIHYYDYDYADAQPTSGVVISYQPDGPGTYSIHWETSTGMSCDQTVIITE